MVITRHHVFGVEVQKRTDRRVLIRFDKLCVAFPFLRPSEEGRWASANGRFKPI